MILNPAFGSADDAYCSVFAQTRQQPQPQPQQQPQSHLCQYQNPGAYNVIGQVPAASLNPQIMSLMSDCSRSLSSQLQMHNHELDMFLRVQSERLKLTLQEQRYRELETLLRSVESKATNMMRQRDGLLAEARNRAMELQASLLKAGMENQEWKRIAIESESTVADLSSLLSRVQQENASTSTREPEDEASACESSAFDPLRMGKMGCKSCGARRSCAVFLPCRHLCSCMACEPLLDACPVCRSPKESSMEVFIDSQ